MLKVGQFIGGYGLTVSGCLQQDLTERALFVSRSLMLDWIPECGKRVLLARHALGRRRLTRPWWVNGQPIEAGYLFLLLRCTYDE